MSRRTVGRFLAGVIAGAVASTALVAGAPAYAVDPIVGPLTSGDPLFPNQGNGGYNVSHYDLDIAWTPGATIALATIDATATITATTTGAPLSSFGLDFEGAGLTVSSVTVNGVAAASFTRQDGAPAVAPALPEAHKLVVTPATAVDGAFTTVVTYAGIPSTHVDQDTSWEGWVPTADGMIFMGQPIGAMAGYPVNNTPADKATYNISLDIPTTITAGAGAGPAAAISNGVLESKTVNGARTTWVWDTDHPMASELALISIGKYDVAESTITLADGSTIPEYSFIDSAQSTNNKNTFNTRRVQLGPILRRLESIYGPYPYDSTGVVMDSVPSGINYALETQDRPFFPSVNSVNGNTLIHELAHEWYGDNVTPRVWNDIWINEGMATWGPTWHNSVLSSMTPNPAAVETTYFNSWNNTASTSSNWSVAPSGMTDTRQLYGYQTYTRGAQFYEALRTAIGDTAYFAFLTQWQVRHDDGNGGAADFEALAEELSGRDLTAFFQDWIWETGKPVWPGKFNLALTTDQPAGPVAPESVLTYTLTVTNTGKVTLGDATATLNLSDVLDDATIGTLPSGVSLNGTTVTWVVPSTPVTVGSNTATVSVPVTLAADASDDTLGASAASTTLGSNCTPATCTSAHSVPIQPLAPAPTPTITGTPVVGDALTAVPGAWPAGTTLAYQWIVGGADVAGETAASFTPHAADVGQPVTVRVTGSKTHYTSVSKTSGPTANVAVGSLTNTPVPILSGSPVYGETLSAAPGAWDAGTTLSYQWLSGGTPVPGATGATYDVQVDDVGRHVAVAVTGAKPGYASVTRTSAATDVVALQTFGSTAVVILEGQAKVGKKLTALVGAFSPDATITYQWFAGAQVVKSGPGDTLKLKRGLKGKRIKVVVNVSQPGYVMLTMESKPTPKVK